MGLCYCYCLLIDSVIRRWCHWAIHQVARINLVALWLSGFPLLKTYRKYYHLRPRPKEIPCGFVTCSKTDVYCPMRLLFLLLAVPVLTHTQTLAVTEYGDTIYVYDSGRWAYEPDDALLEPEPEESYLDRQLTIDSSTVAYRTPPTADKVLSSNLGFVTIHYRDSLWQRVPPAQYNKDAEFVLKSRTTDLFALVIVEAGAMTSEAILKTALHNMKSYTKSEPTLHRVERRQVNGTEVLLATYGANVNGMNVTFAAYFYSSDRGTLQFMAWTTDNLYERVAADIEDLLNGLVIAQ